MANTNDSRSVQVFHDAIHGTMELPPLCVDIINTIQFQRLRNIKQLGLCYYVYPSASHNRFEHCLGTCHLAGKMIRHLKQKILEETQDKNNPDPKITDNDILCVEIAGLCHDLGHAPFSHAFQDIINEKRGPDNKWKHENASYKMLRYLLKKNPHIRDKLDDLEIELDFIKDIIIGKSGNSGKPNFFYQIVNNTTYNIDVDKWDYLARDSHFLGIGTSFDHERMMKMCKVIDGEICYRDKTLKNFYDMFYSRYRLHETAYQHKTVLLLNKLLGEALNSADEYMEIFQRVDDMEKFTYFTDSILEEILNEKNENLNEAQLKEKNKKLKEARNKLKDINNRKFEYKGVVTDTIKGEIKGTFEDGNSKKRKIDSDVEGTVSFGENHTFRDVIEGTEQNFQCKIVAGTKEEETREIEGTIRGSFTGRQGSAAKRTFEGKINGIIFDTLYRKIEGDINGTIEETINSKDETPAQISYKTCTASFDYGAKAENPLTKIPFYTKSGTQSIFYTPGKLESMLFLPNKFKMKIRHCFKMNVN